MDAVVIIIVLLVIGLQFFFFIKNLKRMREFSDIFINAESWRVTKDAATEFVSGISGEGNKVYSAIEGSINKYLANNKGSVIDFQLLKDAVDRHCDSVEEDISIQTPVPLYCGLAGTMIGVIIGLWSLLSTGSIMSLMGSTNDTVAVTTSAAATGVNDLLTGVAWAMVASIFGIILTTTNSLLLKNCKLKEEGGKNTFLAWMQSKLLPELPSDTSDALNKLVKNLNKFNNTFAVNTGELKETLEKVNQSYAIQADIIKTVHDMDVMKMAKANVNVLSQLQGCTDKLETFNEYLDSVQGYTNTIQKFNEQFNAEAERLHVLEEIRDFFYRHKGEISKEVADSDASLQKALRSLDETASTNITELNKHFVDQAEAFKDMIKEEKEAFVMISRDLQIEFDGQMRQMPRIARELETLAEIPEKLETLIHRVEQSNAQLVTNISRTIKSTQMGLNSTDDYNTKSDFPAWMKWVITGSCVLVGVAALVYLVGLLAGVLKSFFV